MRVKILIGVQALKGATAAKHATEPDGGELMHLDPGEVHELDHITARRLIANRQAEPSEERITVRDPKKAA